MPPRLTASTLDGVNRHALVPVAAAPPALTKSVIVGGEGTTFAAALGRPLASAAGPRPEPRIYLTHTPAGSPDEPAGPGPANSVHVFRPDLSQLASREIGFWPRSIDVDEPYGRLYVLHGDTLSPYSIPARWPRRRSA